MAEQSVSELLNAQAETITCSINMTCPKDFPANTCCLSCPNFSDCKDPCKSAETWDIRLRKCRYATGSK